MVLHRVTAGPRKTADFLKILVLGGPYQQLALSANTIPQNNGRDLSPACFVIQSKRGENWSLPVNSISTVRPVAP